MLVTILASSGACSERLAEGSEKTVAAVGKEKQLRLCYDTIIYNLWDDVLEK